MWPLIKFELHKIWKQKKSMTGLIAIAGINILFAIAFILRQRHPDRRHNRELSDEMFQEMFNAFVYVQTILAPCLWMLFPVVIGVLGSHLLAGELELGTLRMVLGRPVLRSQVLLAKFVTLSLYSLVLLLGLGFVSYGIGACILKPSGDLILFGPMFGHPDKMLIVHQAAVALPRIILSYLLAWPMLMAVSAMTLMFSMITRHFTSAAILTVTVYFCSYVVGGIPMLSSIHPYLPTRYFPFWKYALLEKIPWDQIANDALWTGGYTVAFLGVAIAIFNRRDL
jgi:ABC-2 type transport system permease protein